jgi:glutamate synthase (NADPH/NADH) small chain
VVTAIAEGRKCARMVDRHLMGEPEFELEPEDQATITDAHFLELEAQTAGTVTVSDEFFSGPGEPS